MCSSFASLDLSGSSSKSSNSVIHLCRSVKRMFAGSTSGNFSYSASAMFSRLPQVSLTIDLRPLQRRADRAVDDDLRQLLRGHVKLVNLGPYQRMIVTMVDHQQLIESTVDLRAFFIGEIEIRR